MVKSWHFKTRITELLAERMQLIVKFKNILFLELFRKSRYINFTFLVFYNLSTYWQRYRIICVTEISKTMMYIRYFYWVLFNKTIKRLNQSDCIHRIKIYVLTVRNYTYWRPVHQQRFIWYFFAWPRKYSSRARDHSDAGFRAFYYFRSPFND